MPSQMTLCIKLYLAVLSIWSVTAGQSRGKIVAFFQTSCATAAPNPCEQVCTDIRSGGFYCECNDGYTINADGMTCTGPAKPNKPGDKAVSDNDIVQVKSVDLTKGLPPLQSSAHTMWLKSDSSLVLDRNTYKGGSSIYNIPEGGSSKLDSYVDYDIKEGGDYIEDLNQLPEQKSPMTSCHGIVCQNNGTCTSVDSKGACLCPLGTYGTYCESEIEIKYPKFTGDGYLALPLLRNAHREFQVELIFRPESYDGLVLFSAETSNAEKDFFSVVLSGGFVTFRFDCGTGHAELKSTTQVKLNAWNRLVITRVDNKGKLKLNEDPVTEGVSQGEYTSITLRLNLYVGGYSDMTSVSNRVGTTHQFVGCLQELRLNGRRVDFRRRNILGESEFGVNVGECSANVCDNVFCENGGTCTARSADQSICLCPLGFYGDSCTESQPVHVPQFSGHSYLEFPGLQRSVLSYTDIEITFKPTSSDGTLLYNGFSRDRKGDFLSLSLQGGFLEFRFDLGTGPAILRSMETLTMNSWHIVRASRTGLMGTLNVDDQPQVSGQSEGAFTQLSLFDGLYLGGHPNFDQTSVLSNATQAFSGCLQKVIINKRTLDLVGGATYGVNVSPCSHPCAGEPCLNGGECRPNLDMFTCLCPLGYTNTNCKEPQEQLPTLPMFSGDSYLMYNDSRIVRRVVGGKMDLQLTIRPTDPDGLLFWSGEDLGQRSSRDFFALGFHARRLQLSFNLGSGEALIIYNETNLYDGQWHFIRVQRSKQDAYLEVDKKEIVEGSSPGSYTNLNTDSTVYLGGMPDVLEKTAGRFHRGFGGCISDLKLATDYDVKLVPQAYTGRNIGQC
ncbi:pikachurin [Biomphalaria pfeifferi]|uniref:Pikachurin n=1 Tax=Biomphalaria pfeifferi TaxID=112525 RepID=A0AAD8B0X6_BIOPF|nr:pikachurin [Biomphalaria pfeifferi]